MSPAVEIAVEDLAGLEVAALAGADRIELCQDLDLGGTTPAPELVEQAVRRARELVAARDAKPHLDVHVLIRPRASSADFLGRPAEFAADADAIERMVDQAAAVVDAGAAGVVLGVLTEAGELDLPALEAVRDSALLAAQRAGRGLTLILHRAVDAMPSREARVAAAQAATDLVEICAGGGVRPADVVDLVRRSGVGSVHLSARRRPGAPVEPDAPETLTDPAIVAAAVDAAGEL